jgi:hypothetical protein
MDLPKPEFIIEGLLPRGLSFLAGPAKYGKTYLNLQLAVCVASGEDFLGFKVPAPVPVLYLYLEGDAAQVKQRLTDLYGDRRLPDNLMFCHSILPFNAGGGAQLMKMIQDYRPGLVIVDTWQLVRGDDTSKGTAYQREYAELHRLREELVNKAGVSVLLTHHTKQIAKADCQDALVLLNGSTALGGSADTVMILSGTRGGEAAYLSAHGRSIEDRAIHLRRTKPMGWRVMGDGQPGTPGQRELARILKEHPEGISSHDIYAQLPPGTQEAARKQLYRWVQIGKLNKQGDRFVIVGQCPGQPVPKP